jgi:hypothetical protein
MHKLAFYIGIMLLMPAIVCGQHKLKPLSSSPPPVPTQKEIDCDSKRNQCTNHHIYTAKQRLAFFPFNAGGSVRLISYNLYMPKGSASVEKQVSAIEQNGVFFAIKPNEFVIDYSQVIEFQDLSKAAINSLTDILYNIGLTPIKCGGLETTDPEYSCYNPRNAIVFTNEKGKVIGYMAICFECHRHYFSSVKMKGMPYCARKYELLRKFFRSQGITYGTNTNGNNNMSYGM